MKYKNKFAFTLAEVMIVLLVLTILFAVFAPLITKKRNNAKGNENIWQWASNSFSSGPMNAYYSPEDITHRASGFIGISASNPGDYHSLAKIIIRSGPVTANSLVQRQMQFRFGRNNFQDQGTLAGTVLMDTKNSLMGGSYAQLNEKYEDPNYPLYNTGFGYNALNSISAGATSNDIAKNNTAFGAGALQNLISGHHNVAVGYNAGFSTRAGYANTMIGYKAGYNNVGNHNTLIGANSNNNSGSRNTFIGMNTGNSTLTGSNNVAIGYNALNSLTSGNYNVAIGANALSNLTSGSYNVAIGYRACENLTTASYKTCIGYQSGPQAGENGMISSSILGITSDTEVERTFIGSAPAYYNNYRFGGDAVLEIHNTKFNPNNDIINNPGVKSNVTSIINGNLIVKGRTYLTVGNSLYSFFFSGDGEFGTKNSNFCVQNQVSNVFPDRLYCPNNISDRRLKYVGSKNEDGIDSISQLKVYRYKFKNDKNKTPQIGVMAQDLQKVFPNSVTEGQDGFLKIRWDEMFYACINSLKQLDDKVIALTKRIFNFEEQITKLEQENNELKTQVANLSKRIEKLKNK